MQLSLSPHSSDEKKMVFSVPPGSSSPIFGSELVDRMILEVPGCIEGLQVGNEVIITFGEKPSETQIGSVKSLLSTQEKK